MNIQPELKGPVLPLKVRTSELNHISGGRTRIENVKPKMAEIEGA